MDELYAFEVQQGFTNPRDGEEVWTAHEQFLIEREAVSFAQSQRGKWRVVALTVVWPEDDAA